jgi:Fe-S cluster assembly ATPase SufC
MSRLEPPFALEISELRKSFDRSAVDGLNLTVRLGEIYALLGPNGAGKTTAAERGEFNDLRAMILGRDTRQNEQTTIWLVGKSTDRALDLIGVTHSSRDQQHLAGGVRGLKHLHIPRR